MIALSLSSRELASLILVAVIGVYCTLILHRKGIALKTFKDIAQAAFAPVLVAAYMVIIIVSVGGIVLASGIKIPLLGKLWSPSILKDTILEVIFVGFPATFKGIKAQTIRGMIRRVVLPEIAFSTIMQAYLNLETFPLMVEIVLQLVLLFLGLVPIIDRNDAHGLNRFFEKTSMLIGFIALAWSTLLIIDNAATINWMDQARSLLMAFWYPMLLVPMVYLLKLSDVVRVHGKRYRTVLKSQPLANLTIILLLPSIRALTHLSGPQLKAVQDAENAHDLIEAIRQYKIWLRKRAKCEMDKLQLKEHGTDTVDEHGVWQNRAGSREIKRYLIDVATLQSAIWGRGNPGYANLDDFVYRAPKEAIWRTSSFSNNSDSWYAFCKTESGLCYGVKICPGETWPHFFESLPGEPLPIDPDQIEFREKRDCPNWAYDDFINTSFID